MAQRYDNYETVILDDSDTPESRGEVDVFAARHGVRVVRRAAPTARLELPAAVLPPARSAAEERHQLTYLTGGRHTGW